MRSRLISALALLALTIAIFILLLPPILRSMPSRYVAMLPPVLENLGQREHVERLPTAVPIASAIDLWHEADNVLSDLPPPLLTVSTSGPAAGEMDPVESAPAPTPSPTVTAVPIPPVARLEGIVHQFQDWNNCGPATLAAGLSYFGLQLTQYEIADTLKPDPEDRNVSPYEISRYVREQTPYEALDRVDGTLHQLKQFIHIGAPVMVEIGLYPPGEYAWMDWFGHYLLVVGYDDASQQFDVYDSWLGTGDVPGENRSNKGRSVSYEEMDRIWSQFSRSYIVLFDQDKRPTIQAIIGDAMEDDVMWRSALRTAQLEVVQEPENAFRWFTLGTAYNALGHYQRAAAAFDRARNIGLPWRMLWYQFGPYQAYYEMERYQDIIDLADATLQHRPYFEESYYYKGLALAALDETAQARDNLERAMNFNPNFEPAIKALERLENQDT